jgi:hypothetical protein
MSEEWRHYSGALRTLYRDRARVDSAGAVDGGGAARAGGRLGRGRREIGWFIPRDDALEPGPSLEGFYEYYFSARQSFRLGLGWVRPKFDNDERRKLRYLRVPIDVVYNWEGGAVHPFVGAGLGIYILQETLDGDDRGDSETKLGRHAVRRARVVHEPDGGPQAGGAVPRDG